MHKLGFGFVFGILLLMIGATIIANVLFHVELPLAPLAVAIALLALGARLVVHALSRREQAGIWADAWLADRQFAPAGTLEQDARYDVVFGRGVIDLRHLAEPARDVTVTVETVFGAAVVRLDPAVPYDVRGSSAFSQVRLPDRSAARMGSVAYAPPGAHPPRLHLRLNTVFGSCQVVEAPA